MLAELPLWANLGFFALATAMVWFAGTRLVTFGNALAERFDLTREFIGLFFLAAITELPEIVTTLTGAHAGNAPLVLGNMFGGVTMQTAILAVIDLFVVRHALTSWPRKPTHALEAVFLVIFLNFILAISLLKEVTVFGSVGVGALVLFIAYPAVVGFLKRYDTRSTWAPIDIPGDSDRKGVFVGEDTVAEWSHLKLFVHSTSMALMILAAGYIAVDRAEIIAQQSGVSSSFIGTALLAAATSMPELSTTIAAARMGAYTMAISNIFGSNLIMLALIFPADLVYRRGPILAEIDQVAQFSLVCGAIVSAIYVAGILVRKTPRFLGAGLDSWAVLSIYICSLVALYFIQSG